MNLFIEWDRAFIFLYICTAMEDDASIPGNLGELAAYGCAQTRWALAPIRLKFLNALKATDKVLVGGTLQSGMSESV
jgi:hypothetical protein